jgi:hypothetical protein
MEEKGMVKFEVPCPYCVRMIHVEADLTEFTDEGLTVSWEVTRAPGGGLFASLFHRRRRSHVIVGKP